MKGRIDLADGDILAYDGMALVWLSPRPKKMWRYDTSFTFEGVFRETFEGKLLSEIFHKATPFGALDSFPARYEGIVDFGGTPCHATPCAPSCPTAPR